jgi:imidazolonepropionase-like amidohydrolase
MDNYVRQVIRHAWIWDGTGSERFPGEVWIRGNRIERVLPAAAAAPADTAQVIDARGMTLMPGLVEGHAHLSFIELPRSVELGDTPPEEHVLGTMHNARKLLEHGFTSAFSAASAKLRLDVVIRNEINAGRIPGPRLRAASPEITVTGGLGDEMRLHQVRSSFGLVADGEDEIVKAVRLCIREGVDTVKINISGDDGSKAKGDKTVMRENEVRAAVEVSHEFGRKIAAHARASRSVVRAVDCGVDVIYHCEGANDEALDRLEAVKHRVFCGPAIAPIHNLLYESEARGLPRNAQRTAELARVMEESQRTYAAMRRRGIPVVIGGDYGFVATPQGENARDIELYVKLFGYTPAEALLCATQVGGALMGLDVGQVRDGWLADLLLIDGDPVADVRLLQNADNLALIMLDGRVHKNTLAPAR